MRHASNKSIVKWGDHAGDAVLASRLLDGLPRSYPLAIKRKFYRLKNKVKSGKGTERTIPRLRSIRRGNAYDQVVHSYVAKLVNFKISIPFCLSSGTRSKGPYPGIREDSPNPPGKLLKYLSIFLLHCKFSCPSVRL